MREIRGVQPHGPYLLGGYCLGGTIAYEAAQQLHAAGEEVALLALFDTMNWHKVPMTWRDRSFLLFQRLIFHAAAVLKINSESKRQFLQGKFYDLRKRIPVWRGMLAGKVQTAFFRGNVVAVPRSGSKSGKPTIGLPATMSPDPIPAQLRTFVQAGNIGYSTTRT